MTNTGSSKRSATKKAVSPVSEVPPAAPGDFEESAPENLSPELEARINAENAAIQQVQQQAADRATIEYLQRQVVILHKQNIELQEQLNEKENNK